jgi:hypothetical protein
MANNSVVQMRQHVKGPWAACRDFMSDNSGADVGVGLCWINSRIQPRWMLDAGLTDLWVRGAKPEARLTELGDIVGKLDHIARHMDVDDVAGFKEVVQECQVFLATSGFSKNQIVTACGFGGLLLCGAGPDTLEHMYAFEVLGFKGSDGGRLWTRPDVAV